MRSALVLAALTFLSACATAPAATPQQTFMANLRALCGQAFEGRVVTTDAADEAMRAERLVMHVRECDATGVRVPFHVGENRSRTWVITETPQGLRLKHDHRHEDGASDTLTMYGGDTANAGADTRQEFPADAESRALFLANNIPQSVTNVWALELMPGESFTYELARPNRLLRATFDLTRPIPAPPPPWGAED